MFGLSLGPLTFFLKLWRFFVEFRGSLVHLAHFPHV